MCCININKQYKIVDILTHNEIQSTSNFDHDGLNKILGNSKNWEILMIVFVFMFV